MKTPTVRQRVLRQESSDGRPYNQRSPLAVRALGDGRRVVSVAHSSVRVWDRATGRLEQRLDVSPRLPLRYVSQVAISQGGDVYLALDGTLFRLCLQTQACEVLIRDPERIAADILLSPNDDLLLFTGFYSGPVHAFSLGRRQWLWHLPEPAMGSYSVSFAADGTLVVYELDIPQQSGSDYLEFGVLDGWTGEILAQGESVYYDDRAYLSADGTRVHLGVRGRRPRMTVKLRRDGEPVARRPMSGASQASLQYHSFERFLDELATGKRAE